MSKQLVSSMFSISLIFLSWLIINQFGKELFYIFPRNEKYIFPFLWACVFTYLHKKKYFYLAINSYVFFLLLLLADELSFGSMVGIRMVHISYLLISISMSLISVFIYQDFFTKKPRAASLFCLMTTAILYVIPTIYIIYAINFEAKISEAIIYAILQTNLHESLEFIKNNISSAWLFTGIFWIIAAIFLHLKQEKEKNRVRINRLFLITLITLSSSLVYVTKEHIRLYNFVETAMNKYNLELAAFKEIQEKLSKNTIKFIAEKKETGETYIVVIGESLNKKHMGLYGYLRNTTPHLDERAKKGSVLAFNNAFSSHTHTMQVLSQSLTEANQQNKKSYFKSLSIINILNKANINTYWVTNQVIYGAWDNLVSIIAHQTDYLTPLNHFIGELTLTQKYDEVVNNEVDNILSKKNKQNKVIFVHLMGSHSDYCARYPKEYSVFSGKLKYSAFGNLSTKGISHTINCYDNSILYNDSVISSIINRLEKKKGVSGLLYFSDHADDVLAGLEHNASHFTYSMTQIPLIMWFSEQYKNNYPIKYSQLKRHRNSLFSNDNVYDTLIGMFNIETDRYQAINDLSSSSYTLKESSAYTMHGKIAYANKLNYKYHQGKNIDTLKKNSRLLQVIPHRVNSIGKLKDVWAEGYRAFELDVVFEDNGEGHFIIGHDQANLTQMSLETFLTSINPSQINKIWVDFKNLSTENYLKALGRLNYLDQRFRFKAVSIIESSTTSAFFDKFDHSGWHTSYYLPTNIISKLLDKGRSKEMGNLAKIISKQSQFQKLSAVSFDHYLYPFVKSYLEPLLANKIVYHTWDLSAKLYDKDLYINLNKKSLLQNYRSRENNIR